MKAPCTCIITVFNEGERLIKTLDKLTRVRNIDKFIIVDDGSRDHGVDSARALFPNLTYIRLRKNHGKSSAVKAGLRLVKTRYTFLADADLRNCVPDEYSEGIRIILHNPIIDMILFRRIKDMSRVYTGERVLKTHLLKKIMNLWPKADRFRLEVAINQYCLNEKKQVYWVPVTAQNTYKIFKVGFPGGWYTDLKILSDMVSFIGIRNYVHQLRSLASPLPDRYK